MSASTEIQLQFWDRTIRTNASEAVNDILRIFIFLYFTSIKIYHHVTLFIHKDLEVFDRVLG
jgi:hypothetical protein